MSMGLIGRKCGMTRVFEVDGSSVPVTVLQVENNRVTQVKTTERDGYTALQVAAGEKKSSKVNKAMAGHYSIAESLAGRGLWEFRVEPNEADNYKLGAELPVTLFEKGQLIDARGVSIGKGFQGGVKRHNFGMQDATQFHIDRTVRLANVRHQVVFLKVRKCLVIWVLLRQLFRI